MDFVLAIFSFLSSFVVVIAIVCLGWYLVWKVFLSNFRFVRELLGGMSDTPPVEGETRKARIKKARRE